ncbi:MAG: VOC family protein [Xanthobacteraceae bacterium]
MTSITPFLWFDNNVPEAVAFYKSVFPNAKVETVNLSDPDRKKADRAMQAMMKMQKIIIADLDKAYAG